MNNTKISVVSNVAKSQIKGNYNLEDVLYTKGSLSHLYQAAKDTTFQVRQAESKKQQKAIKKEVPAFTVSASFSGRVKKDNLVEYNNLVCIDIDDLEDAAATYSQLMYDQFVHYISYSISGKGLFIIVHHNGGFEYHTQAFEQICNYFAEYYGLENYLDRQTKNVNRLRILSNPDEVYENVDWKEFEVDTTYTQPQKSSLVEYQQLANQQLEGETLKGAQYIVQLAEEKGVDLAPSYEEYRNLAFLLSRPEMADEGRTLFHRICRLHSNYDPDHTEKQFEVCRRENKGLISLGTLFYQASKYLDFSTNELKILFSSSQKEEERKEKVQHHSVASYIGKDKQALELIDNKIKEGNSFLIQAPTGMGKTSSLIQKVPHQSSKSILMVTAYQNQVRQIGVDYGIPAIYGSLENKLEEIEKAKNSQVAVSTFDSIDKGDLVNYFDIIVLDECHELVNSSEYRSKAVKKLKEEVENQQIIYVTATPNQSFVNDYQLDSIVFSYSNPINKEVEIYPMEKGWKKELTSYLSQIDWNEGQNFVIRINNINDQKDIADWLQENTELSSNNIGMLSSDKQGETNSINKSLIEGGNFCEYCKNLRVVLTTSLLDTGINVQKFGNENSLTNFIFVQTAQETFSVDRAAQFFGRMRNPQNARFMVLARKNESVNLSRISFTQIQNHFYKEEKEKKETLLEGVQKIEKSEELKTGKFYNFLSEEVKTIYQNNEGDWKIYDNVLLKRSKEMAERLQTDKHIINLFNSFYCNASFHSFEHNVTEELEEQVKEISDSNKEERENVDQFFYTQLTSSPQKCVREFKKRSQKSQETDNMEKANRFPFSEDREEEDLDNRTDDFISQFPKKWTQFNRYFISLADQFGLSVEQVKKLFQSSKTENTFKLKNIANTSEELSLMTFLSLTDLQTPANQLPFKERLANFVSYIEKHYIGYKITPQQMVDIFNYYFADIMKEKQVKSNQFKQKLKMLFDITDRKSGKTRYYQINSVKTLEGFCQRFDLDYNDVVNRINYRIEYGDHWDNDSEMMEVSEIPDNLEEFMGLV
jgi:hypothetical protein